MLRARTLCISGALVPSLGNLETQSAVFSGLEEAISSPQGPPGSPGPGPRLTHSPWSRRRPLDEFALLGLYLLR